jgi:hypothetical protein
MWADLCFSMLLSREMRNRMAVPSIEELGIKEESWGPTLYGKLNAVKMHRKQKMPFKLIPNCSRFTLKEKGYDWIGLLMGYPLKIKSNDIQLRRWRNEGANKYLVSIFLQLQTIRTKYRQSECNKEKKAIAKKYVELSWHLMSSRAYIVSALNFIFPNWSTDMSLKGVYKLIGKVEKLIDAKATEIKYSRVYIPKKLDPYGNPLLNEKGEWIGIRPLGVPANEWRIYLHMLNNIIVWWRIGLEGSQHAYLPGKGVHTAWKELLNYKDYPWIYEFDLHGFFDEVNLDYIYKEMWQRLGLPKDYCAFLRKMNRSIVRLPEKDMIEEPERTLGLTADLKLNPNLPKGTARIDQIEIDDDLIMIEIVKTDLKPTDELVEPTGKVVGGWKEKGVPQGCPTSCGLSTIALDKITTNPIKEGKVVMYADDGLIFGKTEEAIEEVKKLFEPTKIQLNKSKSGWIKREGTWLKEIKFLGLTYKDGEMFASTRRGSTLKFDTIAAFTAFLMKRREEILYEGSASHLNYYYDRFKDCSPKDWIFNELWKFLAYENKASLLFEKSSGYFLSSLYNNTWNLNQPTSSELLFRKKSWVSERWYAYRHEVLKKYLNGLLECEIHLEIKSLGLNLELPKSLKELRDLHEWARELSGHWRLKSLLELGIKHLEHIHSQSYRRERIGIRESLNERWLLLINSLLPLNIYNVRSYACHDLLTNECYEKPLIRYVLEEPKAKKATDYPRTKPKLLKAMKKLGKEFYKASGLKVPHFPLSLSVKPLLDPKWYDKRRYYPTRSYSTVPTTVVVTWRMVRNQIIRSMIEGFSLAFGILGLWEISLFVLDSIESNPRAKSLEMFLSDSASGPSPEWKAKMIWIFLMMITLLIGILIGVNLGSPPPDGLTEEILNRLDPSLIPLRLPSIVEYGWGVWGQAYGGEFTDGWIRQYEYTPRAHIPGTPEIAFGWTE